MKKIKVLGHHKIENTVIVLAGTLFGLSFWLYASDYPLRNFFFSTKESISGTALGRIREPHGSVRQQRQGKSNFVTANEGDPLFEEDTIVTGSESSVTLNFQQGATVEIGPSSMLRLSIEQSLSFTGISKVPTIEVIRGQIQTRATNRIPVILNSHGKRMKLESGKNESFKVALPQQAPPAIQKALGKQAPRKEVAYPGLGKEIEGNDIELSTQVNLLPPSTAPSPPEPMSLKLADPPIISKPFPVANPSPTTKPQSILGAIPSTTPSPTPKLLPSPVPSPVASPVSTPRPSPSPVASPVSTPRPSPSPKLKASLPRRAWPNSNPVHIQLLLPENGRKLTFNNPISAQDRAVKFMWSVTPSNTPLRLSLFRREDNTNWKKIQEGEIDPDKSNGQSDITLNSPGSYLWRLEPKHSAEPSEKADAIFFVDPHFQAIAPPDVLISGETETSNEFKDKVIQDFDLTLRWAPYRDSHEYIVQLSTDPKLQKNVVKKKVNITELHLNKNKVYQGTAYAQITTELPSGFIATSPVKSLSFQFLPPELIQPKDQESISLSAKQTNSQGGIFFTWRLTNFTESYEIEIATDPDFHSVYRKASISHNFYIVPNIPTGKYWWRVRSAAKRTISKPSVARAFSVTR